MKEEGRVKGHFFLGDNEKTQQFSMKQTKLKPWQQDLHQFVIDNLRKEDKTATAYKLIWIVYVIDLFTYAIRSFSRNYACKLKFLTKL